VLELNPDVVGDWVHGVKRGTVLVILGCAVAVIGHFNNSQIKKSGKCHACGKWGSMGSILTILAGPLMQLIDRLIPDPAAKAAAQLQLVALQQQGELKELDAQMQMALAQSATNTAEAASPNLFTSGWRPGAGWCCVFGLGYQFIAQPLLSWGSANWHFVSPPAIDLGTLITLLMGMLGLGTLRSVDKKNGVAS
jgi:Holin of 3TMs, for gene-transfer release